MAFLQDIKAVREALDRSQSEFAKLMGLSVRAVQSYEQGWRPTPSHVIKLAGMLLFVKNRKEKGNPSPCWKVKGCDTSTRTQCPSYMFSAGDLCWLFNGTMCGGKRTKTYEDKLARCEKCQVVKDWLT